jgi:hypothetical protein
VSHRILGVSDIHALFHALNNPNFGQPIFQFHELIFFKFGIHLSDCSPSLLKKFGKAIREVFSNPTILMVCLESMKAIAIVMVLITLEYTPMPATVSLLDVLFVFPSQ